MFRRVLRFLVAMATGNTSSVRPRMLVCTNCGRENNDILPTQETTGWTCGHCGGGPLVRIPRPPAQPNAAPFVLGGIGAAAGFAVAGPVGALVGGVLGLLTGAAKKEADERAS